MLRTLMLVLAFCVAAWPDDDGPDVLAMFGAHRLTKVTSAPKRISSAQSVLCAPVTLPDGPHDDHFIEVYVSQRQAADFTAGKNDFPEGTVVAKEKRDGAAGSAILYTVMLKRAPGYNPQGGDWEYLVVDGMHTRVIARGKIESCMKCHAKHGDAGFLVRDYFGEPVPGR